MNKPYLLIGLRLPSDSTTGPHTIDSIVGELAALLHPRLVTQLAITDVYHVEAPAGTAFSLWRKVAHLLNDRDNDMNGSLQWFAHLADRRGCELAHN